MNENHRTDPGTEALFGGGTLLGIWAHPDDEAYLSAGLMARTTALGGRVVVAFATRGEVGTDDPDTWPPAALACHREAEARRALRVLGAEPPRWLGHADGGCSTVDPEIGAAQIEDLIDEVGPDVIVTFGRDGITGHDDHRAVSVWAMAAWQAVRRRRIRGPHLLVPAVTSGFVRDHRRWHDDIGFFGPEGPTVTAEADLALRLRLSEVELDRKAEALAAHASQTRALADRMGASAYRHWWGEECFRRPEAIELRAGYEAVAARPPPRRSRPPPRRATDRRRSWSTAGAGARAMAPLLAGVAPFGAVVGATVASSSVDPWVGWSTSWTIYGGTAQLSAVTLLDAGAPLVVLVATVAIINLRLVVYAAALAPHWRGAPRWWRALACYLLVDPSYALGAQHAATDPTPAEHRAYYLGAGATLWVGWLAACGAGLAVGDRLTDVVPAGLVAELMLVSLVAPALRVRDQRAGVVVAAVAAVVLLDLPLGTGALVAAAVGALVAHRVDGRDRTTSIPPSPDRPAERP